MWTARVNLRQSFFLLFRFLYFFLAFLGPRVVAHFVSSRAERKAPSPFQATVLDPWMPVVATKRGSPALSQRNSEKKRTTLPPSLASGKPKSNFSVSTVAAKDGRRNSLTTLQELAGWGRLSLSFSLSRRAARVLLSVVRPSIVAAATDDGLPRSENGRQPLGPSRCPECDPQWIGRPWHATAVEDFF